MIQTWTVDDAIAIVANIESVRAAWRFSVESDKDPYGHTLGRSGEDQVHVARVESVRDSPVRLVQHCITGAGHWVAEQAPDQVVAALSSFLAPYRAKSLQGASSR